jgi:hypothetical protein
MSNPSTRQGWHAFDWLPESGAGGETFWTGHAQQLARQVHDFAYTAVCKWAEEAKMTPEQWLKLFQPAIDIKPDPDRPTSLVVSVKAEFREPAGEHEFTVKG